MDGSSPSCSIAATSTNDPFRDRISSLSATCDSLVAFLHGGFPRSYTSAATTATHPRLSATPIIDHGDNHEREERFRKLLSPTAGRQTPGIVARDNDYLRWENEQLLIEISGLRQDVEKSDVAMRDLQAEVRCLKLNQEQINRIHSTRLHDQLATAHDVLVTREGHLRRRLDDCEREADLEAERYQAKIECLEDEVSILRDRLQRAEQHVIVLGREKAAVARDFASFRETTAQKMEELFERETDLEVSLAYAETRQPAPARNGRGLRRVASLETVSRHATTTDDLERHIRTLESDLEAEREQRTNATLLLARMSQDLKVLLDIAKTNKEQS